MEFYGAPAGGGSIGGARVLDRYARFGAGTVAAGNIPDVWRGRANGVLTNTVTSQVGMAASVGFDLAQQLRYIAFGTTGSGSSYGIYDSALAVPLLRTNAIEDEDLRVVSYSWLLRWAAGVFTDANLGDVIGFSWQGGSIGSFTRPQDNFRSIGLCRDPALGLCFFYTIFPGTVKVPLVGLDPLQWMRVESRIYGATQSQDARFQLRINGAVVGERTWGQSGMPITPSTTENLVPVIMRYGTPAPPAIHLRDGRLIVGPDSIDTVQ